MRQLFKNRMIVNYITVAVVAALFLYVMIAPAFAFDTCEHLPPKDMQQKPNVDFIYKLINPNDINEVCSFATTLYVYGCVRPTDKEKLDFFVIFINSSLSEDQQVCTFKHELGHLPPNNWDVDHDGKRPDWRGWN